MRALLSLSIVALLVLPAGSSASEDDRFAGPWAGRCGDDVQCEANFERTPGGSLLTVRVSDAMDDAQTVCELEADLTAYAPDVLVSGDRLTRVMAARTGEIFISGLPSDECSGAYVNGEYVQFADE